MWNICLTYLPNISMYLHDEFHVVFKIKTGNNNNKKPPNKLKIQYWRLDTFVCFACKFCMFQYAAKKKKNSAKYYFVLKSFFLKLQLSFQFLPNTFSEFKLVTVLSVSVFQVEPRKCFSVNWCTYVGLKVLKFSKRANLFLKLVQKHLQTEICPHSCTVALFLAALFWSSGLKL